VPWRGGARGGALLMHSAPPARAPRLSRKARAPPPSRPRRALFFIIRLDFVTGPSRRTSSCKPSLKCRSMVPHLAAPAESPQVYVRMMMAHEKTIGSNPQTPVITTLEADSGYRGGA
jgi:hypothetical protein